MSVHAWWLLLLFWALLGLVWYININAFVLKPLRVCVWGSQKQVAPRKFACYMCEGYTGRKFACYMWEGKFGVVVLAAREPKTELVWTRD